MVSPTFFFQVNRVASATDSDNWGTTTFTNAMINFLVEVFPHPALSQRARVLSE
jgi:predicted RNase H-like nuclease